MKMASLLKKNFFLLMLGKLVSLIGTQMQNFALSLYVLRITGSATKFASVLAVTLIPQLILGPFAGVFVDWLDRKKIIVYLDLAAGLLVGGYAVLYMSAGGLSLGSIYVLAICLSIISLIFQPAISTVIPSIVEKDELVDANGVNSFIMSIANLAAPALAGVLFGFYGLSIILIINAVSFMFSSICEMFLSIPKNNNMPEKLDAKVFIKDFGEGLKFVKANKLILNIMIMALIVNFFADPVFSIGSTYVSKQVIKVSDLQYGTMESIIVIALIIAPFFSSIVSRKMSMCKIIVVNLIMSGIFILLLAIIPSPFYLNMFKGNTVPYISMIVVFFIIVLITTILNIGLGAFFQQQVPISMMGRISTLMNTMCMAAMPLARMIFGVLFDKIPAYTCIAICGAALVISMLLLKNGLYEAEKTQETVIPIQEEIETI